MLSIGAAQGRYYAGLAQEDYYHRGGEPPGVWHGAGAEKFGQSGEVKSLEFINLCDGLAPDAKSILRQFHQYKDGRTSRGAFDLTFSAPKSVSVTWALADEGTRREIQNAQKEAVKKALDYLEREAAFTRQGKGGSELEKCGLAAAMFEHGTSRAQDPQLHTHAVVLNLAKRRDGTTGTLDASHLFRHKMAAGALYRAELSAQLERRLGVEIVRGEKDTFEIEGVSRWLIEEFSKRRAAIVEAMTKEGAAGAKFAAYFTLTTREKKEHVARELLFESWKDVGRKHSFSLETVLGQKQVRLADKEVEKSFMAEAAAARITETQSYFSEKELVRRTAELCQGRGLGADDVHDAVRAYVTSDRAVNLGKWKGEHFYTTKEVIALEEKMLSQAAELHKSSKYSPQAASIAIPSFLNQEQRKALYEITQEKSSIHAVNGMAGTGKTTLLKTAREYWEAQGYEVKGAALAAVAAKGLEDGAGIKSQTIARLLMDVERAEAGAPGKTPNRQQVMREIYAEYKQATWQWDKKTKQQYLGEYYKPTSEAMHDLLYATWHISEKQRDNLNSQLKQAKTEKEQRPPINERTILVIDEAGMVGTSQMSRLIDAVHKSGGKIVMVGDDKQLQPIEHGAPFRALAERVGKSELKDIRRQRDEWAREAAKDFAAGNTEAGLRAYASRGLLTVKETRAETMKELVSDWMRDTNRFRERLILAGTKSDTKELNRQVQEARRQRSELGETAMRVNGTALYENDRVLFTKNSKMYGVNNGNTGTIKEIDFKKRTLRIELDNGEVIKISPEKYEHIELGYAMTTHKAQGKTVERAFVLAGGMMQDRELSYVQMSRTKGETRIYTEERDAGDTITELAREMSKSRQKELATTFEIRMERERELERTR